MTGDRRQIFGLSGKGSVHCDGEEGAEDHKIDQFRIDFVSDEAPRRLSAFVDQWGNLLAIELLAKRKIRKQHRHQKRIDLDRGLQMLLRDHLCHLEHIISRCGGFIGAGTFAHASHGIGEGLHHGGDKEVFLRVEMFEERGLIVLVAFSVRKAERFRSPR